MKHIMKLQPLPFDMIKSGDKVIESRLFDEKRKNIKIGDEIEFLKNPDLNEKILTKVIQLHKYNTFKELFSSLPSEKFGSTTQEFLINQIEEFYPQEKQLKYGVLGIEIKRISN